VILAILGVIRSVRSTGARHNSGGCRRALARPRPVVLVDVIGGIFVRGRARIKSVATSGRRLATRWARCQDRPWRLLMKIGLQVPDFTWPGGPERLARTLGRIAATADQAGFSHIAVMDHFFQIRAVGPSEHEMLEAYTTLGYLAAHTSRAQLLTLVTGAIYRYPAVLAKAVTTLDVLSGGRAWLGVGAGWNEEESRGLGIPFPPVKERFDHLEDVLEVCLRMWSDDESPYQGRLTRLERPLNSPQALTRPHPPIMIGGGGERKTLRYVARYAQACNLFAGPDLPHKLDVLREHCEREGRDYGEIEKTAYYVFDPGEHGERVGQIVDELGELADQGIQTAIGQVKGAHQITPLEVIGTEVIPAVAGQHTTERNA
jgi:F420-dependent oxidoreductase-like protein